MQAVLKHAHVVPGTGVQGFHLQESKSVQLIIIKGLVLYILAAKNE